MDIDTNNAATRLYGAAALSILLAISSWLCCFVGPIGGIAVGLLTRRQVRWYRAMMDPGTFPETAGMVANLSGAAAIGLCALELVVIIGLRLFVSDA